MRKSRSVFFILGVISAAAVTGCGADQIAAPKKSEDAALLGLPIPSLRPRLIQCPSTEAVSTSSVITALGGSLSIGGVSLLIPAGALLGDALVTVTVPVSQYLEVEINVAGSDHFVFELPVTATISYARCGRGWLLPLSAWHIDGETKALLERMPSIDNKLLRTVTFTTGHLSWYALSGYAVANTEK